MVSLALASAGLVGVLRAVSLSLSADRHALGMTVACRLAQQKLAELRAAPAETIGVREGDTADSGLACHWKTTVQPVPKERFYSALAEVWWQEQGRTRRLALGSLIQLEPAQTK